MNNSDGIGTFVLNEDEVNGTSFDIFNLPEKENDTVYGKEIEIRLLTTLERLKNIKFQQMCFRITLTTYNEDRNNFLF